MVEEPRQSVLCNAPNCIVMRFAGISGSRTENIVPSISPAAAGGALTARCAGCACVVNSASMVFGPKEYVPRKLAIIRFLCMRPDNRKAVVLGRGESIEGGRQCLAALGCAIWKTAIRVGGESTGGVGRLAGLANTAIAAARLVLAKGMWCMVQGRMPGADSRCMITEENQCPIA